MDIPIHDFKGFAPAMLEGFSPDARQLLDELAVFCREKGFVPEVIELPIASGLQSPRRAVDQLEGMQELVAGKYFVLVGPWKWMPAPAFFWGFIVSTVLPVGNVFSGTISGRESFEMAEVLYERLESIHRTAGYLTVEELVVAATDPSFLSPQKLRWLEYFPSEVQLNAHITQLVKAMCSSESGKTTLVPPVAAHFS